MPAFVFEHNAGTARFKFPFATMMRSGAFLMTIIIHHVCWQVSAGTGQSFFEFMAKNVGARRVFFHSFLLCHDGVFYLYACMCMYESHRPWSPHPHLQARGEFVLITNGDVMLNVRDPFHPNLLIATVFVDSEYYCWQLKLLIFACGKTGSSLPNAGCRGNLSTCTKKSHLYISKCAKICHLYSRDTKRTLLQIDVWHGHMLRNVGVFLKKIVETPFV